MKNRALVSLITAAIVATTSIPAYATPDSSKLNESRQKYAEIESRISDIQSKIYDLDAQIEPLQVTVDKNKKEITNINTVIDNTTKDIEQCKKDINTLDLALGQRIKAMYTSGNLEFNYLDFILESESTTDFFSRAQAVSKIVGKDKTAIENVTSKKDELNDKIQTLEDKKTEIDKLNKEVQDNLSQLDQKKKDQEVLINQAKSEKSNFDSEYLSQLERETVQAQFNIIENSNSTAAEIQSAVDQLRNIRDNQIKSTIVTNEINDKIEKAKTLISQKKAAEASAAAAASSSSSSSSSSTGASRGSSSNSTVKAPAAGKAQAILDEAYKHLGKPYVWGATGPDSFDCSGFTSYVYSHSVGIDISRTTYSQLDMGTPVNEEDLQPGDLVFPHSGHVGIYVGNGQMIHAPQTGDVVKVSPVYKFYAARRII